MSPAYIDFVDLTARSRAVAAHIWPILVGLASTRETVTYGKLGDALGVHRRALRYPLGEIQAFCIKHQLPPMTSLVVNKRSQVPGNGFYGCALSQLAPEQERVWSYPWVKVTNPFV